MRLREAKHTIALCRRRIFSDAWEINAEKSGAVISAVKKPLLFERLSGQPAATAALIFPEQELGRLRSKSWGSLPGSKRLGGFGRKAKRHIREDIEVCKTEQAGYVCLALTWLSLMRRIRGRTEYPEYERDLKKC